MNEKVFDVKKVSVDHHFDLIRDVHVVQCRTCKQMMYEHDAITHTHAHMKSCPYKTTCPHCGYYKNEECELGYKQ